MLGNNGGRGVIEKIGRSKTRKTKKASRRRTYKSSEFPTLAASGGLGRVSRSGMSGSTQIKKAKLSESLRSHKAGSASRSTTVGSAKPRRRIMNSINPALLARILAVLALLTVCGLGLWLILLSANSGGKEVTEPEIIPLDPLQSIEAENTLTVDDTGGTVTISLGGTIKLQDEVINAAATGESYDFNNYLSEMKPVMDSDISLLSMVGTVDGFGGNKSVRGYPSPNYPSQIINALQNIGVNYISAVNEFSFSNGFDAAKKTISNLSDNGITAVGVYDNADTGNKVCVKRVNSITVGIGAYCCLTTDEIAALRNEAASSGISSEQLAGCANVLDIVSASATILKDVAAMREAGAQFIIICVNWGSADATTLSYEIRSLAQDMIDNGVDVTLGSGPDVPLKITVKDYKNSNGTVKKCYVFYSLGNFFSDTCSGTVQKEQESMAVRFTIERAAGANTVSVKSANYYPVFVNRDDVHATENTYLKYRVVPASLYVDADSLPSVFSTDSQWSKCKTAFTDIRTLAADKLTLGTITVDSGNNAAVSPQGNGENTNI